MAVGHSWTTPGVPAQLLFVLKTSTRAWASTEAASSRRRGSVIFIRKASSAPFGPGLCSSAFGRSVCPAGLRKSEIDRCVNPASADLSATQPALLACLLGNVDRSPPTVTPSRDAPARAVYASTEYSLMRRLDNGMYNVGVVFCAYIYCSTGTGTAVPTNTVALPPPYSTSGVNLLAIPRLTPQRASCARADCHWMPPPAARAVLRASPPRQESTWCSQRRRWLRGPHWPRR